MTVRTDVNPGHLRRLGIVALFCLGAGLWFLYDGSVTYPLQRERALALREFAEENPELGPWSADGLTVPQMEAWNKYSEERGWPSGDPGPPKSEADIWLQFVSAGVVGLLFLFFITRFFLWWPAWIEADDSGLRSNTGAELTYDQITALDKKKWNKKGIAKVRYQEGDKNKTLVLDDCNYKRDTTNQILRMVEEKIGMEKIINGKPEPPLKVAPDETTVNARASDDTVKK